MENPLVSVVIPVYNGQRFLRQAIDSVLAQTYKNLEAIVVNDGSTDRSAEVMRAYGGRIVAVHQYNMGVGGARNTGMKKARGQFIAFLDQDDWWRPEKVAKQVARFAADKNLCLIYTSPSPRD